LARAQGFKNNNEFQAWKKPVGMPSSPNDKYKDSGWRGLGDFLGNGNICHSDMAFLPFEKARILARAQGFKRQNEFNAWKKPQGMPSAPFRMYKDLGWRGMEDFLNSKQHRKGGTR
jgi:hypothetical protein